jgi:large subunit ribosomal protein L10
VKGQFDGNLYDSDAVEKLSKLPGKDEMRASLLGLFEAPMSQSLAVMEALLTSVIHCVENKRKNDEEQS